MRPRAVEVFAGAGGFAIGAYRAGFKCDLLLDFSRNVCATLIDNSRRKIEPMASAKVVNCDIANFDFQSLPYSPDILLGGPPCQPFSQGGQRRQHRDNRNMFPEAVRALHEARPRAFLFENVKGLIAGSNQNYAELIRLQLQFPDAALQLFHLDWLEQLSMLEKLATSGTSAKPEYGVVMQVLNAADYGVPQKRERVFFAGFRTDLNISWHFPLKTHSRSALMRSQAQDGEYWDRHKVPHSERRIAPPEQGICDEGLRMPWLTIRDAFSNLPKPTPIGSDILGLSQHILINGAREYKGHTGSLLDQPSKTLKAGVHGVPGGENMFRDPTGILRYFTIRECARLQTFPDEFEFVGSRSEQIRQLGNAVPCLLAEVILRSMKAVL
jgi:DNA (cytosine-5)-methyltransferase 1